MRAAIRTSSLFRIRPAPAGRILLLSAVLLAAASCTTVRPPVPDDSVLGQRPPLSGADAGQAEALARYSQFLLLQAEQPESPRLPDVLRQAVLADPSIPTFHLWLAQAYLFRGRAGEAVSGLEDAVSRYPDSDALLYVLGLAYEACERLPDAETVYLRLLKRSPKQPEAYLRLTGIALKRDQPEAAFAFLDDALRRVDEPLGVLQLYDYLGEQYLAARKPWLAVICFSRIAGREPGNKTARERLMKSRLMAGDLAGAVGELEALRALDPGAARWPLLLGEMAEEREQYEQAADWYAKAVQAPDAEVSAWIRLALMQSRSNPAQGLATLREAAVRFPKDVQAPIAAGAILFNAHRPADAIQVFDIAEARMNAAPSGTAFGFLSPYFYFWYGAACDQAGQPERAEKFLERSITLFPDITEAHNYLAYIWAQKNVNLDKALAYARQAVASKPDNAAYQDTLGWVLFRKGDLAGALAQVQAAAKAVEDAEISLHMADILSALGRRDEALAWWRKSAALDPKGPAAKKLAEPGAAP